jgi:hypothetical protein
VGATESNTTSFQIIQGYVNVKDSDGKYQRVAIEADLDINLGLLRRLLQKAFDNRGKKSSDGPLLVRIANPTRRRRRS